MQAARAAKWAQVGAREPLSLFLAARAPVCAAVWLLWGRARVRAPLGRSAGAPGLPRGSGGGSGALGGPQQWSQWSRRSSRAATALAASDWLQWAPMGANGRQQLAPTAHSQRRARVSLSRRLSGCRLAAGGQLRTGNCELNTAKAQRRRAPHRRAASVCLPAGWLAIVKGPTLNRCAPTSGRVPADSGELGGLAFGLGLGELELASSAQTERAKS